MSDVPPTDLELPSDSQSSDELREVLGMSPRPPPLILQPGQRIGDSYRIERKLGAGGMGVVYLARDEGLARDVAIKIHPVSATEQLEREATAIARLVHPNVVTVHQIGRWEGHPFVVMEYVEGFTARSWLAESPRSCDDIVALYTAAGRGLAAAHAARLTHRDFKPDNVLVGRDGRVRVADFGLARDLTDDESAVTGTPGYMAPEQRGEGTIGPAADQFAFAVSLWEALCGERPFSGGANRLRRPSRRLPRRIARVLERALATDPGARFASVDELLAMLAPRRRSRVLAVAALGVGVLAAVGISIAIRARRPDTWVPRTQPHAPSYDEDTYPPAISPDGTLVAYASDRDRANWYRLYVAPVRGGIAREIPLPPTVTVTYPRWSDGGRAIVFTNPVDDYAAYRVWLAGGPPERLAAPGVFADGCGERILFGQLGAPDCTGCERLVLREASGHEREVFRVNGEFIASTARCDRAGRRVVFSRRRFDDPGSPADLWLLDLETGASRQLTNDTYRNTRPVFHPDGQSIIFSSDRAGNLDLYEIASSGGAAMQLTSSASDEVGADITPDGALLLFNTDEGAAPLFARDTSGGSRRRITPTRPNLRGIQVSPDAREVVAIETTNQRRVVAIDLRDGSERTIAQGMAVSVTATEVIYASAAPTTIFAVPRAGGVPRTLGTVDGVVELMRPGGDDFIHLQVLHAGERQAWRMPLAGGPAEREAPAPWCFIHPAPVSGWRVARRCATVAPPEAFLIAPGAELSATGVKWISVEGDWDARGETYLSYEHTHVHRVIVATGEVQNLFGLMRATGISLSPDGQTIYVAEDSARVRRHLVTNFADRR